MNKEDFIQKVKNESMKLSKEQSTELFSISSDLNTWFIQMLKMAKRKKQIEKIKEGMKISDRLSDLIVENLTEEH